MKRYGILILLLLAFCGEKKIPETIRAKVVTSTDSKMEYKVVQFKYLTDPKHMDGVIAKILGGTVIDADVNSKDVISGDPDRIFSTRGSKVRIDFVVDGGVIIAQNFDSLAMLSLYYDYEKIVDFWIDEYGFTLEELGKFNIHYSPSIAAKRDGLNINQTHRLNAAYFSGLGDFLIFKTSRLEALPIKMNPAVIAHEFGHKIFDIRFANKNARVYESRSRRARWQLNGINEGVADFVAYLFTQQTDLYIKSLNTKIFQKRILPVNWTSSQLYDNPSVCGRSYYCKGSILASALYELSTDPAMTPKKVGTATIQALSKFKEDWDTHRNDEAFDYYYLLNRIVKELPTEEQTLACKIFKKWFDDALNLGGLKEVCP